MHRGPADRETEPDAPLATCVRKTVESFEQAAPLHRRNSVPSIKNVDANGARDKVRLELHSKFMVRVLECVLDQVDEHELDERAIEPARGKIIRQVDLDSPGLQVSRSA